MEVILRVIITDMKVLFRWSEVSRKNHPISKNRLLLETCPKERKTVTCHQGTGLELNLCVHHSSRWGIGTVPQTILPMIGDQQWGQNRKFLETCFIKMRMTGLLLSLKMIYQRLWLYFLSHFFLSHLYSWGAFALPLHVFTCWYSCADKTWRLICSFL